MHWIEVDLDVVDVRLVLFVGFFRCFVVDGANAVAKLRQAASLSICAASSAVSAYTEAQKPIGPVPESPRLKWNRFMFMFPK